MSSAQDGSAGNDLLLSAAAAGNGTFVLAGSTEGAPNGTYTGVSAMAAMKLDMYGDSLWTWQVRISQFFAVAYFNPTASAAHPLSR